MGNKAQFRNILVIKLRHIGDVLLTSALFGSLREACPGARITALVNAGTEAMLLGNPAVDEVLTYDRRLKKGPLLRRLSGELSFYKEVRSRGFDLVLNLTEGDRGALVALVSGARVKVGVDPRGRGLAGKKHIFHHILPRNAPLLHTVEKDLRFLAPLGIEGTRCRVSFHFSDADRVKVESLLSGHGFKPGAFFHAHVTSRWMFKALPPAKIAFLLDRLSEESGLPAVLTCAPDKKERDYLASVVPLIGAPHLDLGGALTLKQLGAVSAASRFFAGVDSAPMHMAAALDVPTLGIFGPSPVQQWGPWDNTARQNPYVKPNGIQKSGSHLVLQAERPCVPCHTDGCNGSKVSDCLDFPEKQLQEVAREFLEMNGLAAGLD